VVQDASIGGDLNQDRSSVAAWMTSVFGEQS
jgi:hypothetical protein